MGQLDQPAFERLVRTPCPACGGTELEIRSFIDRTVATMLADPTESKWIHDGEKFVDGTYRIACAACTRVVFEDDACPRCHAAGGLARALGQATRLAVPRKCPKCNELEFLAIAFAPAVARYTAGSRPTPQPLAELGELGFHVVAFACDGCDHNDVVPGCPLCDAPGPLRKRP